MQVSKWRDVTFQILKVAREKNEPPGCYNKRTHQCLFKRRTTPPIWKKQLNQIGFLMLLSNMWNFREHLLTRLWSNGMELASTLINFQFVSSGIRVWKAYKIGPRKLVSWKDIQSDDGFPVELEVLEPPLQSPQSSFRIINQDKSLYKRRLLVSLDKAQPHWDGMDEEEAKEEGSGLFNCSKHGCIRTFQRSSGL